MLWLGTRRGYVADWFTQQWVRATGRRVDLRELTWLDGPAGKTDGIGSDFFDIYAAENRLEIIKDDAPRGLVGDMAAVVASAEIQPEVKDFYENTSEYDMDCWSEWSLPFRPFGRLLALPFSRRLGQLNVPLTGLDTHRGISSRIVAIRGEGSTPLIAWVRELPATGQTLYAGCYTTCRVPGYSGECIKVCFPLPNGRAMVIMRPEVHADGSLTVISDGKKFGDPGFYLVVEETKARAWARYVQTMKETIHVYSAGGQEVRADHVLRIFGQVFLRLHYRLTRKPALIRSVP